MILYYALGGGLGHLTRARAVAYTLGLTEPITILTASPFAQNRQIVGPAEVLPVPPALSADLPAYRAWLQAAFERLAPTVLYLDAFPAGILGELCDFPLPPDLPIYHLARLLRWNTYAPVLRGTPPTLTHTHLLEPLDAEHLAFLHQHSASLAPLLLHDPPPAPEEDCTSAIAAYLQAQGNPLLWLIVHAGAPGEVAELLAYATEIAQCESLHAADLLLLLLAPERPATLPPHIRHRACYPAPPLFPLADRIITACGFNSMRQTAPYHERHRFLPFPRYYDDQFRRAARRRQGLPGPHQG